MFAIVHEQAADWAAREKLLDAALGARRFTSACARLREGRAPARGLAFSAHGEAGLLGTLRFWHIDAGGCPALMLGPLAVAKTHRSLGLGRALVEHGLAQAKALGHRAVLLVGDAPYYSRFGFEAALTQNLVMPGPVDIARFLAMELAADALASAQGVVQPTGERLAADGATMARGGHRRRLAA